MHLSNVAQKRLFIVQKVLNACNLLFLIATSIIIFFILKKVSQTEVTMASLFDLGGLFRASNIWDNSVFFISISFIIYGTLRFSMLLYPIFIWLEICIFYTYILLRLAYIFIFPSGDVIDASSTKACYALWGLFLFAVITTFCVVLKNIKCGGRPALSTKEEKPAKKRA